MRSRMTYRGQGNLDGAQLQLHRIQFVHREQPVVCLPADVRVTHGAPHNAIPAVRLNGLQRCHCSGWRDKNGIPDRAATEYTKAGWF
jgi:hypothetical protein